MSGAEDSLVTALFSELIMADQLARSRVSRALPKGMELSHFSVLNHLARANAEKSPAQLARSFNLTRGAMTNTLRKLETAGYVHIRPDWDDARRKQVSISPAGRQARDAAISGIGPVLQEVVRSIGDEQIRATLRVLRDLRTRLEQEN